MREVLQRFFGRHRDEGFDELRRSLATNRAIAAKREIAVVTRARQFETGHYLGDRAGRRISAPASSPGADGSGPRVEEV